MVNKTQKLGKIGEKLAEQYLRAQNYQIVKINFRTREGEVDLIAKKNGVLIFVEVKTRKSLIFGEPVEAVDEIKLRRLTKMALTYIREYNWDGSFRLDVIGITWKARDGPKLEHLKNVYL